MVFRERGVEFSNMFGVNLAHPEHCSVKRLENDVEFITAVGVQIWITFNRNRYEVDAEKFCHVPVY